MHMPGIPKPKKD